MSQHTVTENGAVALATTGNCFVDFFTMLVRNLDIDLIKKYMDQCWDIDPKKTLAIVFNARDRLNGKKEKSISNRCMIWLKTRKYNTYMKNLINYVNKYGCWKDVLYICSKTQYNNSFELDSIVKQLQADVNNLKVNNTKQISLCAKWVPSQQGKYDDKFNIAHDIASLLYPCDSKMMEKYRKEYLTPLRKEIKIVESYMCSNQWKKIKYENVPAVAMKRLKSAFMKHDADGYGTFLKQVASGAKKINITGILPHELVMYYLNNNEYNETIELQWNTLLHNIKSQMNLKNMMAVVDISGSMYDNYNGVMPIHVSIALGLIIAECNTGFFAKKVISFHSQPTVIEIQGNTLQQKIKHMLRHIPQGIDTNFEAVFDLLLNAGKLFNISVDDMPKTVIVLSDMQFNIASFDKTVNEETLHETIQNKYAESPYTQPKFIYWNLSSQHDATFPVRAVTEDVAIISGFSEQLLKVFMDSNDFDPNTILDTILLPYMSEVVIDVDDLPT
jgi:hypothetical protein